MAQKNLSLLSLNQTTTNPPSRLCGAAGSWPIYARSVRSRADSCLSADPSQVLEPGLISQANGSAYIETEKTKLACAVYGPRQSKSTTYNEKGKLNVEVKFSPFSCTRRRSPLHDAEDRSLAVAIHQSIASSVCLELLPKSTIDIFITIIENDGIEGCIASGAIAASTALADAGIEMFGLVASCSVVREFSKIGEYLSLNISRRCWVTKSDLIPPKKNRPRQMALLSSRACLHSLRSRTFGNRVESRLMLLSGQVFAWRCVKIDVQTYTA
ncbi:3' exoribonuclease family, domain 1-domain-containing protein [Chiua virens]|nr:3' exoribonuclease family, domain 1-domain-containing protein [Chiua virens]